MPMIESGRGVRLNPLDDAARASRELSKATLRRTLAALREMVAMNGRLAAYPEHRASAEERIIEGERVIAFAEAELALLERE